MKTTRVRISLVAAVVLLSAIGSASAVNNGHVSQTDDAVQITQKIMGGWGGGGTACNTATSDTMTVTSTAGPCLGQQITYNVQVPANTLANDNCWAIDVLCNTGGTPVLETAVAFIPNGTSRDCVDGVVPCNSTTCNFSQVSVTTTLAQTSIAGSGVPALGTWGTIAAGIGLLGLGVWFISRRA
jgi:hypothetical protein